VVDYIRAAVAGDVVAQPLTTLHDLMDQMSHVDTVVATRYHNVLCALKVGKPTLSIGYAAKNDVLMAAMGLGEFCQPASSVRLSRLVEQFEQLEARRAELTATLAERNRAVRERLGSQFAALSTMISGDRSPVGA
jgi:polysaccharide pyruvyl transferase WcaK-like protein